MKRHAAVFGALALALAGLDLLTKTLALAKVPHHGEHKVIPGWFSIGHEYNPGVIWSFMQNAPWLWLVVSVLAIPLIGVIFVRSRKTWTTTICLGMIESGTIGNCWDRIFHPGVRDFIKVYIVRSDSTQAVWPLFNLADSCIVVGVILLSVEMFFFEEKQKKHPNNPNLQLPTNPQTPTPNGPEAVP